jgi:hypothetical protein
MKPEETEAKYTLLWSGQRVKHALTILKNDLDALNIAGLDVQDKRLVTLIMDNLFTSIMVACKDIRDIKKEVKNNAN